MKNASSLKSKPETPKTPGGISKSLLTPCRRVGLSRNWRKSVTSPFNSPLASTEPKHDNAETRKRKESLEETPQMPENYCDEENVGTPIRKVELPRRKKSKTLLKSKTIPEASSQPEPLTPNEFEEKGKESSIIEVLEVTTTPADLTKSKDPTDDRDKEPEVAISTPVRQISRSKSKKKIISKSISNTEVADINLNSTKETNVAIDEENEENSNKSIQIQSTPIEKPEKTDVKREITNITGSGNKEKKVISPNNLTKECIVLIQKKIFKSHMKDSNSVKNTCNLTKQDASQALFNDSDSDDVPLNCLNKTEKAIDTITIDDDHDFAISTHKLKKTSSKNYHKETPARTTKENKKKIVKEINNTPSQNSVDEDDDFFEKKTILIRKTYDKVIKPSKAKSTGSITQKDIEDLKARIEIKKKMLLAKSMTDTKELRELIKKWQKGCQDALVELMDLMKNKCPEQNMEYSQILQTLKIPANLVGYDSDNDCFVTPDDENIILSHIKE